MKVNRPFQRLVVILAAMGAVLIQGGTAVAAPPSADLSVIKSDSPDPVAAGANITYAIDVHNDGPSDATTPKLTDAVPANTTFVSFAKDSDWTCSTPSPGGTGTVTCDRTTDMPDALTESFTLVVHVITSPTSCTIKNTASVSSSTSDPDPSNNSDSESTKVSGCADVSVTKTDSPDPVTVGTTLTYTITVKNNDTTNAATSVKLTDTIPLNTTFVSLACPAGWTCTPPAVGGTGPVTATNPSLAAGASSVFTLKVRVGSTSTSLTVTNCTITNTATVTATTIDPDSTNNTAKEDTHVANCADLAATKTAFPNPVIAGTNLTYTITVHNNGPDASLTPKLSDVLPVNTTFVSVACPAGWTCSAPSVGLPGTVTATSTSLANGATATFTLVVMVVPETLGATVISNTATVSAGTVSVPSPDPESKNDTATANVVARRSADLSITKTARPHPVKPGHQITYTITVANDGPSQAKNAKVRDFVGHHVVFLQVSAPADWSCSHPDPGNSGRVRCTNFGFGPGDVDVITIVARVKSHAPLGVLVSNTARVASPTPDPNRANNARTATARVRGK